MSTAGKVIKCKAAIAWEPKTPLAIEEIEVAPPKAGEVRIKIVNTGLCHSDAHVIAGVDLNIKFPCILGHEGAGVVESVGEGVTTVKEGDHVVPIWMPECGTCEFCKSPTTNLCSKYQDVFDATMDDGSTRFTCKGKSVYHFMGTSTFSQYTVTRESGVVKVDKKAPLDKICLIGCGITTGYGSAINTAQVKKGSTCAVWGLGAVGLATVMGCRDAGATRIIGIDINPDKFEASKKFGVTECVNPKDHTKPIQEVITELTNGGCDYTFEAIGSVVTMKAAFESCRKGWGKATIIGVVGLGQDVPVNPFDLILGKEIKGALFGGYKAKESIPKLVEQYMNKKLMVDEFVTFNKSLSEINDGFDLMVQGKSLRTVLSLFE